MRAAPRATGCTRAPDDATVRRFVTSLRPLGSPAATAQARLMGRLLVLKNRYVFSGNGEDGADPGGLAGMFDEAFRGTIPLEVLGGVEVGADVDSFLASLRGLETPIGEFNSTRLGRWKRKAAAAERTGKAVDRVIGELESLGKFPAFALAGAVMEGWRKDCDRAAGFCRKVGRALVTRDAALMDALDPSSLDRDGSAAEGEAFGAFCEQLERLRIEVVLDRGSDPAVSYARLRLLDEGEYLPKGRARGRAPGRSGRAGKGRAGTAEGVDPDLLGIISRAFRTMMLTMLALVYIPFAIMGAAVFLGAGPEDSEQYGYMVLFQLAAGFCVPALFALWTMSTTGFDRRGARLFDPKFVLGTAAVSVVLSLWWDYPRIIREAGDVGGVALILASVMVSMAVLSGAPADPGTAKGESPMPSRLGLALLVSMPAAWGGLFLTALLYPGALPAEGTVMGVPVSAGVALAGMTLTVWPATAMVSAFIIGAAGAVIRTLVRRFS